VSGVPDLLPGVDRAAFGATLADHLRRSGISVGLSEIEAFTRALSGIPPRTRTSLYWTARVTLVRRADDLARFDAVFDALFGGGAVRLDPHARRRDAPGVTAERPPAVRARTEGDSGGADLPWAALPGGRGRVGPPEPGDDDARAAPLRLPSPLAGLADVPFPAFDTGALVLLDGWLAEALESWPTRRSRRLRPAPTGPRVDLRQTLAGSRRTGFEPARLVRARQVPRRRRVVMLCDVSRSMQPYAAAYLHLLRAAVVAADAEVFAFSSSLTRLTPALAHASAEVAVDRATTVVDDRFGGTHIAGSIRELLRSRHEGACRGAVVLVASDGWDSDPPEALGAAVASLRRRAHRLLWLNPRAAAPGFSPSTGGMAAALPHCDQLLPAHTVAAMAEVVAAIVRR
jgi:uncharacterized protein with von Willebrand factor type A (vWA) domain